ncbi:MAG: hypothetical protein ACFFA0_06320 [Promethearchaeota archaeon]
MKTKNVYLVLLFFTLSINFLTPVNIAEINERKNRDISNIDPVLSDITVGNYTVPGVTGTIPPNQILKIGVLGDINDITGNHSWKGAMLAAREKNEAGGLLISGTPYYIGIVAENTDEANPNINPATGVAAALRMVNDNEPHFVLGGYRFEYLVAYRDVLMDNEIPFISIGCPVDDLCQHVIDFYPVYKYFFRVTPINTTALTLELVSYISNLTDYLSTTYEGNITGVDILREDLAWTYPIYYALNILLPLYNLSVYEISFPITIPTEAIGSMLSGLDAAGTQIVIPLISGHYGTILGQYYGEIKPRFLLTGLNYHAQSDIYWDDTAGGSQYEIVMHSAYNTSKTSLTIPFWNNFFEEYGEEPFYTAVGSYDAVRLFANAADETQTFDADSIVLNLESKDINDPFLGASGNIAFSNSHDIVTEWPYGTSLFCQWQMDGNKVVVPSWNSIYPDSIATGTLSIPYWGINDLVEDNSHKLPGNFTLTTDADPIDIDGAFNLSWTPSDGADTYSIYYSEDPITYISRRYTTFVETNIISPYTIFNLETGDYYFVVVAYNGTGQKFSNNIFVSVQIPEDGAEVIPGYNIMLFLSCLLIISLIVIRNLHKKFN